MDMAVNMPTAQRSDRFLLPHPPVPDRALKLRSLTVNRNFWHTAASTESGETVSRVLRAHHGLNGKQTLTRVLGQVRPFPTLTISTSLALDIDWATRERRA